MTISPSFPLFAGTTRVLWTPSPIWAIANSPRRTPPTMNALSLDRGPVVLGIEGAGHGFVAADSHFDVPVDGRPLAELAANDLVPFAALVREGLEAVMPAHVI